MKTILSLLLLIITVGCTSKKSGPADPKLYLKLNKQHAKKHTQCIEQKKSILEKAITETSEAELDDEHYFFIRNEEKALKYIKSLDIQKFTLQENQLETEAVMNACVSKIDPSHKFCDTLYPAMKYFRGLMYALRQYTWSPATKQLAVEQILTYINYVGESKSSLMEVFHANDLLMRLSNFGYIPQLAYHETVSFRHELEDAQNKLRVKIEKLSKKKLTCEIVQDIYQAERQEVEKLSNKLLVLVRKIN